MFDLLAGVQHAFVIVKSALDIDWFKKFNLELIPKGHSQSKVLMGINDGITAQ